MGEVSEFTAYNSHVRLRVLIRLAAFMTAITFASTSAPVSAKPRSKKQRVRRYKSRAFKAFAKGKYAKGIKQMRKAHALRPHPGFLLNIALGYEQWGGHCTQALSTLDEFFEACPACKLRPKGLSKQAEIRALCPALVRVETDPSGAELQVDGQVLGHSPTTLKLSPGPHEITAIRPGHMTKTTKVEVVSGETNQFRLELAPVAVAEVPAKAETNPKADPKPKTQPTIRGRLKRIEEPPTNLAPWAWTAMGIGVVSAGVGAFFTLQTFSALDAEEQARSDRQTKREVEALQQDATNKALAANIGFGVGGAAILTGIILLLVDPDDAEPEETTFTPLLSPRGLAVQLRF